MYLYVHIANVTKNIFELSERKKPELFCTYLYSISSVGVTSVWQIYRLHQ